MNNLKQSLLPSVTKCQPSVTKHNLVLLKPREYLLE
jgi:hypothetical protein